MTFPYILIDFISNLGWVEIIVLQAASVVLGYFIHFFISGPKIQKKSTESITDADTWRMKYYEELSNYKKLENDYSIEVKEYQEQVHFLNNEINVFKQEIDQLEELLKKYQSTKIPANYLDQLYNTQHHLLEHQQNINKLLSQIEDYQNRETQYNNAVDLTKRLQKENHDLRIALNERDLHIERINQELELYADLKSRLEQSYADYKILQEKLNKVESYLVSPKNRNFDYDELQNHHLELAREYDDAKSKQFKLMEENQRLVRLLADTEDRLKEAQFQRQQLQKKLSYLEAFNKDLQSLGEQNKKFDTHLKRIIDVEHQLNKKSINKDID